MRPDDIQRLTQRNTQELWREIVRINKRLDYIEPRENRGGAFAYGEIFVHDAAANQVIAAGAGYTKLTLFVENGYSLNCTNDVANDKITITEKGIYVVNCTLSFSSATVNANIIAAAFLNGVEQDHIHFQRKIAAANDVGDASMNGFIDVTSVPWDLDVRMRHDIGVGINVKVIYGNLNCHYLGVT